jgi:hypothetical protein
MPIKRLPDPTRAEPLLEASQILYEVELSGAPRPRGVQPFSGRHRH